MPRLSTFHKADAFEQTSSHGAIMMLSGIATLLFAMLIGLIFMS